MIRYILSFVLAALAAIASPALAEPMPDPQALQALIGTAPAPVRVYEPHLTKDGNYTARDYLGYPAEAVFAAILGADWRDRAPEIEFRALDGYVSRIAAAKFQPGKAFLVFALADGSAFKIDVPSQNQKDIPLGPYYLVWDNISDAALRADGANGWPYQVAEILPFDGSYAALLPEGVDPGFREAVDLARHHCLSCHQINGFGGEKVAINLAEAAKPFASAEFVHWLLNPSAVRESTTMPPITYELPEAERLRIAKLLYAYLQAVPVVE